MRIVAYGASNSLHSINKALAAYTANKVSGVEVVLLDINKYELPLFSVDLEQEIGQPQSSF